VARPKKADIEKRENRLTIYLTDQERDALKQAANMQNRPMTQAILEAIHQWLDRLINPPEALRMAKHEQIMSRESETLRGYICRNGHPFWVEWVTATEPRCCPVCGSEREMKRIWDGTIKKGF